MPKKSPNKHKTTTTTKTPTNQTKNHKKKNKPTPKKQIIKKTNRKPRQDPIWFICLGRHITYPYFKHTAQIMMLNNLQRKELDQHLPCQCLSFNCSGFLQDYLQRIFFFPQWKIRKSGIRGFWSRSTTQQDKYDKCQRSFTHLILRNSNYTGSDHGYTQACV